MLYDCLKVLLFGPDLMLCRRQSRLKNCRYTNLKGEGKVFRLWRLVIQLGTLRRTSRATRPQYFASTSLSRQNITLYRLDIAVAVLNVAGSRKIIRLTRPSVTRP